MKNWLASLRRHKSLKLLSLLLALALWFTVSGEERIETTLTMALEMVNLPPNLMVTSEVPPVLQVRVMGPRSIIAKLAQTRLTQTVDLAGFKAGQHNSYLGPNSFSLPRGVQVIRIQPNPLNLTLAPTLTRTLPIKPVLENLPPEGYELLGAETRPAQVTVKGPHAELADLKFIPTLPIDLSQLTEHTIVATDLDFKNLHLALKEPAPILADLNIAPKTVTRTLTGVPVVASAAQVRLAPSQIALTVKGPWPRLKELKLEDVKATVDTRNLAPGRHRLNVSVDLPAGVTLVRLTPATLTVTVARPSI